MYPRQIIPASLMLSSINSQVSSESPSIFALSRMATTLYCKIEWTSGMIASWVEAEYITSVGLCVFKGNESFL